jgi:hypothetical protein
MAMSPRLMTELGAPTQPDWALSLRDHGTGLVKLSRGDMSKRYARWDRARMVYGGKRPMDQEDVKAVKKAEPAKFIVPMTFAQAQTFVTFGYMQLTQSPMLFQLFAGGPEDEMVVSDWQKWLQRDCAHNKSKAMVYQFLLDLALRSMGVLKPFWTKETMKLRQEQVIEPTGIFSAMSLGMKKREWVTQAFTKFHGNKFVNVSPYRWFPDTRKPLAKFQEGEFCASEDEFTRANLKRRQADNEVTGVEHIVDMTQQRFGERGGDTRHSAAFLLEPDLRQKGMHLGGSAELRGLVLDTEIQLDIIPNEYKLADGKPLGDEDYPVRYVMEVANDDRVIRLEPMGYLHGEFTYSMAEYTPDMVNEINEGMAEMIDHIQNQITFLCNSRATSLRKNIDNRFVVDPMGVNVATLESRSPIILLNKGASKTGVDRWIKELQVTDVTQNNMNDVQIWTSIMQMVTGANDNAMGQYNGGRRSATEASVVSSGAAGRMLTIISLAHETGLSPAGRQMLINARQGCDEDSFSTVIAKRPDPQTAPEDYAAWQKRYAAFKGTVADLICMDDAFIFDSTTPAAKGYQAQALQELLGIALQNPETAMMLNINLSKLFRKTMEERGIRNPDAYMLTPQEQAAMMAQLAQQQALQQNAQQPTAGPGGAVSNPTATGTPQ